jgi:hypothetical protein
MTVRIRRSSIEAVAGSLKINDRDPIFSIAGS